MARPPFRPGIKDAGPRVNEDITAEQVRLIDGEGNQAGVVTIQEALAKAEEAGLDLVEVSPGADPPVCKVLDYGKYKYEQQKKAAEARKKQKTMDVKEVKMRPGIEEHDYGVKLRNARRFLEDGDKVKVSLRFRGREIARQDIGREVMDRFRGDLADFGKTEFEPKMEGRQMIMVLTPESKK